MTTTAPVVPGRDDLLPDTPCWGSYYPTAATLDDAISAGRILLWCVYDDLFASSRTDLSESDASDARREGDNVVESTFCDLYGTPVANPELLVRDYFRRCTVLKAVVNGDWTLFEIVRLLWCLPANESTRLSLIAAGVWPGYFDKLLGRYIDRSG